ncbi:phosphatase PAP2 family protein [bacterium]|nr:phosphatase PAP2 family protein [bacterium]
MRKTLLIIFLFFFSLKVFSFAPLKLTYYSFKNMKLQEPFFKTITVLFATTVGISFMDRFIKEKTIDINSNFNDSFFEFVNNFGEGKYYLPAYFLVCGGNQFIKSKKLSEYLNTSLSTYIIAGAANSALKRLFGRYRPFKTEDQYTFKPLSGNDSFPSGHAMLIFSIFVPLGKVLHLDYIFIPLSFLFSFARVYKNAHWASDVFFAGAMTTLIAKHNFKVMIKYKDKLFTVTKTFYF